MSVSYRLWSFDEDFGLSQLELVLVHVDGAEEVEDSLTLLAPPARPRLLGEDGVPAAHDYYRQHVRSSGAVYWL